MSAYIEPILTACFVFPLLAFFMTIPYLIYEYRKYGSVLPFRTLIVYSFVLYLLASYFLVILPLPSRELVAQYTSPRVQLELGRFIKDILVATSHQIHDFGSFLSCLKSSSIYTVLFNLFLTLPFGIYLRYYYQRKWYQVLIGTFCLSLFFELTQLTGLYGIYPRSYRLFDVDDLLINTTGGMLGYFVAPLFSSFLPSREHLDEKAFERGQKVSVARRGFAYFIDLVFFLFIFGLSTYFFPQFEEENFVFGNYLMTSSVLFLLFPLLFDGRTLGKIILRIRLVNEEGETPKWYQIFFRYFLIHFLLIPTPYYLTVIEKLEISSWIKISFFVFVFGNYFLFLIQILKIALGKRELFSYEILSHTKNESTIKKKEG